VEVEKRVRTDLIKCYIKYHYDVIQSKQLKLLYILSQNVVKRRHLWQDPIIPMFNGVSELFLYRGGKPTIKWSR